ncbi:MAG: acetate kinase [Pseudomonadota bacterium]
MNPTVLTINSGSSSVKASLFRADGTRRNFNYEHLRSASSDDHAQVFTQLLQELRNELPVVVGHRFVHGGDVTEPARIVDGDERTRLQGIARLAPLHMPGNLLGLDLCARNFKVPQVACFDTAFHISMPEISRRLPIAQELGMRRYGFHGLNYAYIAKTLPEIMGAAAYGKIVVAHLGSGASLCLLENLKSVDTSMGYTPAGGIPMGTRSGDLDPGVMLELAQRYTAEQLSEMVFNKMGLIALSDGESAEMATLLSSSSKGAKFAVTYFCRQVRAAIGGMATKAGGIDALVFSGGIGEHSSAVRAEICDPLAFLGFKLDRAANQTGQSRIGLAGTKPILLVPADEEAMIRDLCLSRWLPGTQAAL